jgi:hypothetical protein
VNGRVDSAQSGRRVGEEYPPNTRLIWKFELRPWSLFIEAPKGATILSAGTQKGEVVVWARCNPDAPKVSRLVAALPTGTPIPPACEGAEFVATVQMDDGLVFHVFDGGERA